MIRKTASFSEAATCLTEPDYCADMGALKTITFIQITRRA